MKHAQYTIVKDIKNGPLTIKDVGDWTQVLTITNDAEFVVDELFQSGDLYEGRRLFYYDSLGDLSEISIGNGHFQGFVLG